LGRKTLHRALNELLADWEDHGIQEFVLLTAHRHELHLDALLMAMTSSATTIVVNLLTIEVDDLFETSRPLPGEIQEASLLLHLAPELAADGEERSGTGSPGLERRYDPRETSTSPGDEGHGRPTSPAPSAQLGKVLFERYAECLIEVLSGPQDDVTEERNAP
jgi:creatinine amidohydrolase